MNKYKCLRFFSFVSGIALILIFLVNYNIINQKYPNPAVETAYVQESLNLGDYILAIDRVSIISEKELSDLFPESDYLRKEAESELTSNKAVILIDLEICGNEVEGHPMALYNTTLAYGYSTNGMDLLAFNDINKCDPFVKLDLGERIRLILPYTINKSIDYDSMELIFALYPQIIKYVIPNTAR